MILPDWARPLPGSLRARVVVMLSIAILPLGVVAVYQTNAVIAEAMRLEQRDILSRTLRSVNRERGLLAEAHGAAAGLAATVAGLDAEDPACAAALRRFVAANPEYALAGLISADGIMRCSTADRPVDFRDHPDWHAFLADPRPMVAANPVGEVTGASVLIVTLPVRDPDSDALLGALSLSMPHNLTDSLFDGDGPTLQLALVDGAGRVLTASTGMDDIDRFTALGIVPTDGIDFVDGAHTRSFRAEDGTSSLAVLMPLLDDRVFVLALWDGRIQSYAIPLLGSAAPLFPVIMWVAALGVALFAMDTLVIRHLRRLGARMSRFTPEAPGRGFVTLENAPREIEAIATTYNGLLDQFMADRALLAESIDEKEVLLREVHHRVKNNLQLIASILNMQIRTVADPGAQRVLRRVQDRVMSLSAIHKALYTGAALASVRADRLLGEVLQNTISIGLPMQARVGTNLSLEPVEMDPDQAVPLTLLANELVTNAVKYVGRPASGTPAIAVTLRERGDEIALVVTNTTGQAVQDEMSDAGTGLGTRLIAAFVSQLDGTFETTSEGDLHRAEMRFASARARDAGDEAGDEPDAGDRDGDGDGDGAGTDGPDGGAAADGPGRQEGRTASAPQD